MEGNQHVWPGRSGGALGGSAPCAIRPLICSCTTVHRTTTASACGQVVSLGPWSGRVEQRALRHAVLAPGRGAGRSQVPAEGQRRPQRAAGGSGRGQRRQAVAPPAPSSINHPPLCRCSADAMLPAIQTDVCIVGGGPAGLSAAHAILRARWAAPRPHQRRRGARLAAAHTPPYPSPSPCALAGRMPEWLSWSAATCGRAAPGSAL